MTRINQKFTRPYINGVDVSGYASDISELGWLFDFTPQAAFSDEVMNGVTGKAVISAGNINSFLDNDTAGLHALSKTGQITANLMVGFGTNAVPAAGDPMFAWTFEQANYQVGQAEGFIPASIKMDSASYAGMLTYKCPWGVIVHPKGAETAVNTAVGIDDNGAATALGGIFCYQLFSSNGTVTLSMQDAATNTNPSFAALSGATSGSINASVTPVGGMVALSTTATVRRYLRWQLAFGTATTATFALGFIRAQF